ncbi:MAG: ferritin-like domain-containing protein, partial [Acidimicrobiales bacterium]
DWDAPGAELITDEQRPALTAFMTDLVWIEHIGGRGFAALAKQADDPTLVELYRYFHAEEQRHANVEMALMQRWGMLEGGKIPEPNINLRMAMSWLDGMGDDLPLSILSAAIPMLEVALDGALLKFLLDAVADPLCHAVFERVNNDESRHLAVGFEVMDRLGSRPIYRDLSHLAKLVGRPTMLPTLLLAMPLMSRMRNSVIATGLDEERLHEAIRRYGQIGDRGEGARHNPAYQVIKRYSEILGNRTHPVHVLQDRMFSLSDHVPSWLAPKSPSWAGDVTFESVA